MFKFATIVVLVLLGIGLWLMLSSLFSNIGEFFVKRSDNFMYQATKEEAEGRLLNEEEGK